MLSKSYINTLHWLLRVSQLSVDAPLELIGSFKSRHKPKSVPASLNIWIPGCANSVSIHMNFWNKQTVILESNDSDTFLNTWTNGLCLPMGLQGETLSVLQFLTVISNAFGVIFKGNQSITGKKTRCYISQILAQGSLNRGHIIKYDPPLHKNLISKLAVIRKCNNVGVHAWILASPKPSDQAREALRRFWLQ